MGIINENEIKELLKGSKAIFFDMDGTLLNSEALHAKALEQLLLEISIHIPASELEERYFGLSDLEVYHTLVKEEIIDNTFAENDFIKKKSHFLLKILEEISEKEKIELVTPGTYQLLGELRARNYKLALISASETEIVDRVLTSFKLKEFFHTTASRTSTFLSKPAPSPYLQVMRQFHLKTNEVLIVEDSPTGLKAATLSGAKVLYMRRFSPPTVRELFENYPAIDNFSWRFLQNF